jgi:hypothetical protein
MYCSILDKFCNPQNNVKLFFFDTVRTGYPLSILVKKCISRPYKKAI